MAEELKHLLDRIQKEGVDRAEDQAAQIVADARGKATQIVADAKAEAAALIEKAERDADAFAQRGAQSLQHAARDVILGVGDTVTRMMETLERRQTETTLTDTALTEIVVAVVKAYCADASDSRDVTLLAAPEQCDTLSAIVTSQLGEALAKGVEVRADDSVTSGFRVTVKGEHVEHDFTAEAIANALCGLLRPRLAEVVKSAVAASSATEG